jgi:hypothetical protein
MCKGKSIGRPPPGNPDRRCKSDFDHGLSPVTEAIKAGDFALNRKNVCGGCNDAAGVKSTECSDRCSDGLQRSRRNFIVDEMTSIQREYQEKRFAFVPSVRMRPILATLGATDEDLDGLKATSDNLAPDPTLSFRKSKNGRFMLDMDASVVRRLEFQPFVLSAAEGFVRHDSGQLRRFRGIQDDLQSNTAFQALIRFKALVTSGVDVNPRPMVDVSSKKLVTTVFHLRTVTNQSDIGHPAIEGVHSDGVEHTMTTFLGSENMRQDSALSLILANSHPNGVGFQDVDQNLVLGAARHRDPFDTLLIVDSERKHAVSEVFAKDPEQPARRDMLVVFTRHPFLEGHPTYPFDSLKGHQEMPLEFPLGFDYE